MLCYMLVITSHSNYEGGGGIEKAIVLFTAKLEEKQINAIIFSVGEHVWDWR